MIEKSGTSDFFDQVTIIDRLKSMPEADKLRVLAHWLNKDLEFYKIILYNENSPISKI
jgi:hypothetical protein